MGRETITPLMTTGIELFDDLHTKDHRLRYPGARRAEPVR